MNRSVVTGLAAAAIVGVLLLGASLFRSVLGTGAPLSASTAHSIVSAPSAQEPPVPSSAAIPREPPIPTESAAAAPRSLDEPSLMARLRELAPRDPEAAIALAREGNDRFPNSAESPERASILIHSLAREGRASEARGEAEAVVNRYPDSTWVREIEGFTGAHRHRTVYLDPDGALRIE